MPRQANVSRQICGDRIRAALLVIAAGLALGGCARAPTVILTHVEVDSTVHPLFVLRATVTSDADPTITSTASYLSVAPGDAADMPAPYFFPMELPIDVTVSVTGAVTVTIEGLDYVTQAVVARGTGAGRVVKEQQTTAALVMTAVQNNGPDGGTASDDGGADANAAAPDGAADDGSSDL